MHLICDLHVHTNASADGHCPVEKVLERAKAAGLDAVAVTDHDTTVSALKALSLESEVIMIPLHACGCIQQQDYRAADSGIGNQMLLMLKHMLTDALQ